MCHNEIFLHNPLPSMKMSDFPSVASNPRTGGNIARLAMECLTFPDTASWRPWAFFRDPFIWASRVSCPCLQKPCRDMLEEYSNAMSSKVHKEKSTLFIRYVITLKIIHCHLSATVKIQLEEHTCLRRCWPPCLHAGQWQKGADSGTRSP